MALYPMSVAKRLEKAQGAHSYSCGLLRLLQNAQLHLTHERYMWLDCAKQTHRETSYICNRRTIEHA